MNSLTLYDIETGILELLDRRDDLAAEICLTAEAVADRDEQLQEIDNGIRLYVQEQVAKVDNIAGLIRECATRAATLKAEEERIRGIRKRWEDGRRASKTAPLK